MILVAACAREPLPARTPVAVANHTAIGDAAWPSPPPVPPLVGLPTLDAPLASQVIMRLGPVLSPALDPAAAANLRDQLPTLKGTARLLALDRLADASEVGADEGFDEAAVIRKLQVVAKAYDAAIAAPGFATYANADQVLLRAAHIHFEMFDDTHGIALATRLIEHYPRSPWLADADVMIGNAIVDHDAASARNYYDDAIAAARPSLVDYARFARLHALEAIGDYRAELADGEQLARAGDGYREPAAVQILRAYAEVGDPDDARARFAAIDPTHLPTLLRKLADEYGRIGKNDDALRVLDDIFNSSTDSTELCAARERGLVIAIERDDRTKTLDAARALVAAVKRASVPACTALADRVLGELAWSWQLELVTRAALPRDDEIWQLALAVVTTPERRNVELRDRAYLSWLLARQLHTSAAWFATAAAFDAAYLATPDLTLSAGAELARSNARNVER